MGGMSWEIETDVYILLCVKQLNNENLLYRRGNSSQCSVAIKRSLYVYVQLIYFSVQKKSNDYKATKFPIKNITTNTKKKAVCLITAMSFLKFLKELENLLLPQQLSHVGGSSANM